MLKQLLIEDMKSAMRQKQTDRLNAIRLLRAAIQRQELDQRSELNEQQVQDVIVKQIKQVNDSIAQFKQASRDDLVEKEQSTLSVFSEYIPKQLSQEKVQAIVEQGIIETKAESMKDMGKLMGWLKPKLNNQADMGIVSKIVKSKLNN